MEHLKLRQNISVLPREVRRKIGKFVAESSGEPPAIKANVRKRCQVCPVKKDHKTNYTCESCNKYFCFEYIVPFCADCTNDNDSE